MLFSFQKSPHCHTCETITTIDVISLFQSTNLKQQSHTLIATSKPQISRQLLESLVTVTDSKMPLAQNYKDDVSLLESEAALSKATMDSMSAEFDLHQDTNAKTNVSEDLHFIMGVLSIDYFYLLLEKKQFTNCDIMLIINLYFYLLLNDLVLFVIT
jgi:hypothetical protein